MIPHPRKMLYMGAFGTFVASNFQDHLNKDKEVCQGKPVADVSKHLENAQQLSGGQDFNRKG